MFNYVRFCNDCNDFFKSLPALGGMFFSKDRCDRCGLARMMSHPWHWWWLGLRGEQNLLLYITVRHRDLLRRIWRILKNEKNMKNQRFAKQKSAEFDLRNVTKARRRQRPILRSVQWLANRVLGEKKTQLDLIDSPSHCNTNEEIRKEVVVVITVVVLLSWLSCLSFLYLLMLLWVFHSRTLHSQYMSIFSLKGGMA